jgi:hypothetical protein
MQAPDPRIVPLLEGSSLGSGHGSFAFCSVVGVQAADASAARLVDLADVVHPGHDRPFRVADGQTEYLSAFSFTLTGVARDDPGLRAEPAGPFTGPEDLTAPADGPRRRRDGWLPDDVASIDEEVDAGHE